MPCQPQRGIAFASPGSVSHAAHTTTPRPIGESLREYGRGIAGGMLFSMPLLYTQEIWRGGQVLAPERLLLAGLFTALLLVGYNRYSGLRRDASWAEVLIDSVEEFGLGLLVAALALWLLGRIGAQDRPRAILGMVVLEGMLAAIGVSVGTAQLGGDHGDTGSNDRRNDPSPIEQIALSSCGAILIASNVAPTGEVITIAASLSGGKLLGLMAFSLVMAAIICFYSDFIGPSRRQPPSAGRALLETALTYSVAFLISAALLWFFGRFDGQGLFSSLARTTVLSVGTALGAAAGRRILQQ